MYVCIEKMQREPSWFDGLNEDDQNQLLAYWRLRDKMKRVEENYVTQEIERQRRAGAKL